MQRGELRGARHARLRRLVALQTQCMNEPLRAQQTQRVVENSERQGVATLLRSVGIRLLLLLRAFTVGTAEIAGFLTLRATD